MYELFFRMSTISSFCRWAAINSSKVGWGILCIICQYVINIITRTRIGGPAYRWSVCEDLRVHSLIRNASNIVTTQIRNKVYPVRVLSFCSKISYCVYINPKLATYLQRSWRQGMSLGRIQPGRVSLDDQWFYYQRIIIQLHRVEGGAEVAHGPLSCDNMYASKSPVGPPPTMSTGISTGNVSPDLKESDTCSEWGAICEKFQIWWRQWTFANLIGKLPFWSLFEAAEPQRDHFRPTRPSHESDVVTKHQIPVIEDLGMGKDVEQPKY